MALAATLTKKQPPPVPVASAGTVIILILIITVLNDTAAVRKADHKQVAPTATSVQRVNNQITDLAAAAPRQGIGASRIERDVKSVFHVS
jgi:hypothetical protein